MVYLYVSAFFFYNSDDLLNFNQIKPTYETNQLYSYRNVLVSNKKRHHATLFYYKTKPCSDKNRCTR